MTTTIILILSIAVIALLFTTYNLRCIKKISQRQEYVFDTMKEYNRILMDLVEDKMQE